MKKTLLLIITIILILSMISSCGETEPRTPSVEYKDAKYGDDANQTIDMYLPDARYANGGVILLIHGGAWVVGDKINNYTQPLMDKYKDSDYIVATMNYRFTSDTLSADGMMQDIESALNFIYKTAKDAGIKADKAMLVGWSSGGHTAELYSYKHAKDADIQVACVVAYSGIADLNRIALVDGNPLDEILGMPMSGILSDLCGYDYDKTNFESAGEYLKKISPITYADTAVPTVICHSEIDTYIEYSTAKNLKSALDDRNIENTFIDFPISGHDLLLDPDSLELSYKTLEQYAEKYIK